jgi:hypothetical protein
MAGVGLLVLWVGQPPRGRRTHHQAGCVAADPGRGRRPPWCQRQDRIIGGTEIRVRRPPAGWKDQDKLISGKSKQYAFKTVLVPDEDGRVLFCCVGDRYE